MIDSLLAGQVRFLGIDYSVLSIITTISFEGGLLNSRKSRGLKLARIPKLAIISFHILTQWRRYISLDFLLTSLVL